MHQYVVSKKDVSMAAMIKSRCAVRLARVSIHGVVEIYVAFRYMRGIHVSGSPVAGSVPDT
jgi:hypothetical protein